MTLFFSVLIVITCVLLIVIVLVQNPKGGGLSSSFGGSGTQLFGGVKKTTDFLDKGTWGLAIVLVGLVLMANVMLSPEQAGPVQEEAEVPSEMGNFSQPATPSLPTQGGGQAPVGGQGVQPQGEGAQQQQRQPASQDIEDFENSEKPEGE